MLLHIIERFLFHFAWSILITGGVFTVIRMAIRKDWRYANWLPYAKRPQLVLAAVLWPGLVIMREAVDTLNGQPIIKAFTDSIGWMVIGVGGSIWLLYRYGEEWSKGE